MYVFMHMCTCFVYLYRWVCVLVYFPGIAYTYACMTNTELAYTGDKEAKIDKKAHIDDNNNW